MDQQISLKPALTNVQVDDNTKIVPWVVGATGFVNKATVAQLKLIFSTQQLVYTATGTEGTALVISALAAKAVLMIAREGSTLYPVVSAPDSVSYIWDFTTITFGLALNFGERFLILYKNV